MALSTGDKAECKEIAREIIKEVLSEHISACPWGKKLMLMVAFSIGSGVASGGAIFAVLKVVVG